MKLKLQIRVLSIGRIFQIAASYKIAFTFDVVETQKT